METQWVAVVIHGVRGSPEQLLFRRPFGANRDWPPSAGHTQAGAFLSAPLAHGVLQAGLFHGTGEGVVGLVTIAGPLKGTALGRTKGRKVGSDHPARYPSTPPPYQSQDAPFRHFRIKSLCTSYHQPSTTAVCSGPPRVA